MQLDARETRGDIPSAMHASLNPAEREPRTTDMMDFDRTPFLATITPQEYYAL